MQIKKGKFCFPDFPHCFEHHAQYFYLNRECCEEDAIWPVICRHEALFYAPGARLSTSPPSAELIFCSPRFRLLIKFIPFIMRTVLFSFVLPSNLLIFSRVIVIVTDSTWFAILASTFFLSIVVARRKTTKKNLQIKAIFFITKTSTERKGDGERHQQQPFKFEELF